MRTLRRLHALLTFVSLLALAAVLALWHRSASHADTFIVRTAPSYPSGPPLKWLVVRTHDGFHLSMLWKFVPAVEAGDPPWRGDVPVGFVAPGFEEGDAAVVKRPVPPMPARARPMTDPERQGYETRVATQYAATRVLRWHAAAARALPDLPRFGPTDGGRLGVRWLKTRLYTIGATPYPGAYREQRVRVPFALAAAACALPLLTWVPVGLKRRAARRRLRKGMCPRCGYDLRETPGQCPECGRVPAPGEREAAAQNAVRRAMARIRRVRPRNVILVAGTAAAMIFLATLIVRPEPPPSETSHAAEALRLRKEIDAQLDAIAREVNRLRQSGDEPAAAALETELKRFRRRADGHPPPRSDEPQLHLIGLYEGDVPGGKPGPPAPPPAPTTQFGFRPQPPTHPQGTATVEVTVTDRPVVLALSAYDPVKWDVRVAPGVRLRRVILTGHHAQHATGIPAGVPVETHTYEQGARGVSYFSYRGDDPAHAEDRARLRAATGLPITTFQGTYTSRGRPPFVVGPRDAAWEAQRILAELRPVYGRASDFERARARDAARAVRFTAVWREDLSPEGIMRGGGARAIGRFDATGPIEPTLRTLPILAEHAAIDVEGRTWCAGRGGRLSLVEPETNTLTHVASAPGLARPDRPVGLAYDPRRKRLLMITRSGVTSAVHAYTPSAYAWSPVRPLGRTAEYVSLTFSEHDDRFYALSGAAAAYSIVCFDPDGVPLWQIPVPERVGDVVRGSPGVWPPQIAAAGPLLAIITPPLPDPHDPDAPPRPRCVLIEPKSNTVQYSGVIEPHEESPAPSAAAASRPTRNEAAPRPDTQGDEDGRRAPR